MSRTHSAELAVRRTRRTKVVAAASSLLLGAALVPLTLLSPVAQAAPVGQGFTVTPSDLAFILKQIKIAEAHVANTTAATGPCGAMLGNGPNQIPNPLLSFGLRTVDGSCNNLQPGRDTFAASDQVFPRLGTPVFRDADPITAGLPVGPLGPTSYAQKTGNVVDSEPRVISNLIVDQTSTNPAAVEAAGHPVRTQGNPGVVPCTSPGVPIDCVPAHKTLFIPNVTTDVGLSPPYNSLFTLFGQFFDHGVDQTVKSGATVFVPLKADDPLIAGPDHVLGNADDLPASQRFMVLTRAQNQPGPDGVLGNADDVQDATNTDTPFVDQSQTYTSHASHQVFLREYVKNNLGRPVSSGRLLSTADGGIGTWADVKAQARTLLGLQLVDSDVTKIPMIAVDPYGKFIPGPARGLPQYVTATGLVEGNTASPVAVPPNVRHFDTPFLTDIAHNADPSPQDTDNNPATPPVAPVPDADSTASADFAHQPPGTYDDEMLDAHFACGDGRCNENIGLTAIHQIFHSEHDRLVGYIKNVLATDTSATGVAALPEWQLTAAQGGGAAGWNGERLFQAVRFVTEMEYQHLVFEEFARKIQPAIEPFTVYHDNVNAAIKAEYAHAVYRFGHSMLTETISRLNADGSNNDIPLLDGFLNPPSYTQRTPGGPSGALTSRQAAGSIFMGMSDQVGNELDEFVTETLRNNLLGLPLDLATINMARAREAGVPPLNVLRKSLFATTNDSQLKPYSSWADYGIGLKHPESLINFVAAYGLHPSIRAAATVAAKRAAATLLVDPPLGTDPAAIPADAADFMNSTGPTWSNTAAGRSTTGLDNVDLWVGGLAEKTNLFGGLLGSTFNYVFEKQLTDLQNGDRLYYLARTPGMNLRTQLEGNSFAELIERNTNATGLKADAFGTADAKFCLGNLGTTGPIPDDPFTTDVNEPALLLRMPDGTIRYRARNSVDPPGINGQAVYNGTEKRDRIWGGVDNDTILGNAGDDVIEGDDGADVSIGGDGNDVITDLAGDDVLKGGPGNDAIDAGPGADIVMAGDGKDFTNGGLNANETFGGDGNDMIIAGGGTDTVFGDSGDDWIEGGDGQDLLQGDSGAPFFDDPNKPGNDVLIGQNGEEDYDAEGGDDILIADAGIERNAGAGGFDWSTHERDTVKADTDLNLSLIGVPLPAGVFRDRFQEVEALSGGKLDDILRGDDVVPSAVGGAGFTGNDIITQDSVRLIAGLGDLLPPGATADATPTTPAVTWGKGNILLGGPGSDLIEGRGADDIIDGDAWLGVQLQGPDLTTAAPNDSFLFSDMETDPDGAGPHHSLQEDVFAGRLDPGDITIVRSIQTTGTAGTDIDTALYSGAQTDYTITGLNTPTVTVTDTTATDGVDTLRNVESLTFQNGTPTVLTDDVTIPTGSGATTMAAPVAATITPAVAAPAAPAEPTCELLLPQTPPAAAAAAAATTTTPAGVPAGTTAPGVAIRPNLSSTLSKTAVNVGTKVTLNGQVTPFKGVTLTLTRRVGTGAAKTTSTKVIPLSAASGRYSFNLATRTSGKSSYSVAATAPGLVRSVSPGRTLTVYRAKIISVHAAGREFVTIKNTGKVTITLAGWKLRDASGTTVLLPRHTLKPSATVRIYTGRGVRSASRIFLKKKINLWNRHDTARLIDRNKARVSQRRY
ncbi:MAG: hypothetical protein QOI54_1632 [Actinomycetota bacterium]|nr:hypothetical protein [Actinomycetota bacterium]